MKKLSFLPILLATIQAFGCTFNGPVQLHDPGKSQDVIYPQICVSANGDQMAIYREDATTSPPNTGNELYYNHYDNLLGTWTTSAEIFNDNSPVNIDTNQTQASLDCFPNGDAVAVWHQNAGNPNFPANQPGILGSVYDVLTDTWTATNLQTTPSNHSAVPDVATLSGGAAIAVWSNPISPNTNPFAGSTISFAYYDGTTWQPEGTVSGFQLGAGLPHICSNGQGLATAVWIVYDSAAQTGTLWSRTYTQGTGWGAITQIPSAVVNVFPFFPSVVNAYPSNDIDIACDPTGNAIVAWAQYIDNNTAVIQGSYYNGSTWSAPTTLSMNNADLGTLSLTDPPSQVSCCKGPLGYGQVIFRTILPSGVQQVEASLFDATTNTFQTAQILETSSTPGEEFSNPQVGCSLCGTTAIWKTSSEFHMSSQSISTLLWTPIYTLYSDPYPLRQSTYLELARPVLASDAAGNSYPLINVFDKAYTFDGTCFDTCEVGIIPGTFQVMAVKNRGVFETNCVCQLAWKVYPNTVSIVSRFDIFKNGVLLDSVAGGQLSYIYPGVDCNGTYTIIPYSTTGLELRPETVFAP